MKSGTLFDYFKAKREIVKKNDEELYPVHKLVELEEAKDSQDNGSDKSIEELEPIASAKLPSSIEGLRSLF